MSIKKTEKYKGMLYLISFVAPSIWHVLEVQKMYVEGRKGGGGREGSRRQGGQGRGREGGGQEAGRRRRRKGGDKGDWERREGGRGGEGEREGREGREGGTCLI